MKDPRSVVGRVALVYPDRYELGMSYLGLQVLYDAVNRQQLDGLESKAFSGIAAVSAVAAIPEPNAGKNYSVGLGFGYYEGYSAGALGIKAKISDYLRVMVGGGISRGNATGSAGLGFCW